MKILLLGKTGQIGWELQRSLVPLGEVVALDHHGTADWCGDLLDPEGLARTVARIRPQVIVNAAAYTAVDRAEAEAASARRINAEAPAALARAAAACDALLVHYGTDYVFDGQGDIPWREDDTPAPLNVYGQTKLEGERAIVAAGCRHLILRTSWVYAARGNNFIQTVTRLARSRERLAIVDDQWGTPTGAELVADVTAQALAQVLAVPAKAGIYHLSAHGATSWFLYAQYLVAALRRSRRSMAERVGEVTRIPSSAYPTAAARPLNSRLDTSKLRATFGLALPPWEAGVDRVLAEMAGA